MLPIRVHGIFERRRVKHGNLAETGR